jgi:nucleoside-diphosphate-sugar epimerase
MIDILTQLRGKKIGIVGLGYVGNHLLQYLSGNSEEYGFLVIPYDRETILDLNGERFDYFFNCAGNTGDFRNRIWPTIDSNLVLTRNLFEKIKVNDCYVALSSTRLYGYSTDENVLFSEYNTLTRGIDHLNIDFVYDGTKMLLESILWNYRMRAESRIAICRMSNIYGKYKVEDLNDSTFLKKMIRCKVEGKSLKVEQNIFNTKGYIYIDDAVQGILRAALYSKESDIYNICSGESYSISDWLKYLKIDFEFMEEGGTPFHSRNSIDKAITKLKFKPKFYLKDIEFKNIYSNGASYTI